MLIYNIFVSTICLVYSNKSCARLFITRFWCTYVIQENCSENKWTRNYWGITKHMLQGQQKIIWRWSQAQAIYWTHKATFLCNLIFLTSQFYSVITFTQSSFVDCILNNTWALGQLPYCTNKPMIRFGVDVYFSYIMFTLQALIDRTAHKLDLFWV